MRLDGRFSCDFVNKPSQLRIGQVVVLLELESPPSPEEERYGDGQGGDEGETEGGQ